MSEMRKRYFARLAGRCIIFLICTYLCYSRPDCFEILNGMNFFQQLSPLHVLWGIWILDMVLQIIPIRNKLPIGSQKLFASRFRPIRNKINAQALR